jgi:hypothetical protein
MSAYRCMCHGKFSSQSTNIGSFMFRTTQDMSSCNCTWNIGIINVDTVNYMSLMIWKCEVHIWIYGCLTCLYDIKAICIILFITLFFHFHFFPPNSVNKIFEQVSQLAGEMWELVARGAQVQNNCQLIPIQRCEAQCLRSEVIYSMLLYSHCVSI